MGRKTLESLPGGKPLANRLNIVLTSKDTISNCICVHTLEELVSTIKSIQEDIYIIGGASIYEQLYPASTTKILITRIDAHKKADAYFPHFNINKQFKITEKSDIMKFDKYKYQFLTYERITEEMNSNED